MDYRNALLDELDPERKHQPVTPPLGGPPMETREEAGPKITDTLGGAAPTATPAPTDYTTRGQYATFNAGSDKYARPWDQMSERYKMQTVLSHFDPNQGITPEVIAALNKANINGATFSGSGDKLDARGLQQWENYDGREGIGDIIRGFKDPNNKHKSWGAWAPEEGSPSGGGSGMFAGSSISPMLQSSAPDNVQSALGALAQPSDLLAQLIAQLQGSTRS